MSFPAKAKSAYNFTKNFYGKYVTFIEKYASSILLLTIRIFIGLVFFKSGLVKFSNIEQTIILFEYEYEVPFLSPQFAAISSLIVELGCGALIMAGLLTRIIALPLIGLTLVIQLLVFQNPEHFYWLFLLSTLAVFGGGKLSADGLGSLICKLKNK